MKLILNQLICAKVNLCVLPRHLLYYYHLFLVLVKFVLDSFNVF